MKIRKKQILWMEVLLTISPFWVFSPLNSQTQKEAPLTLVECLSIALQNNPLLLSSQEQHRASLARVNIAKAFPQPSLNFDSDLQPSLFNFKKSEESYFGLSQTIEFPGKRFLRGRIASREADEFLSEVEVLKLDIVFAVKEAFFGLLLAKEKVKHAEQNLELSDDFHQMTELKFSAGDVSKAEVLRARVEASKAANLVKVAQNEVYLRKAALNFLLARKKDGHLEIRGELKQPPLKLNLEELREKAFSFRPEMKRISFSLEKESLKKKLAYLSYFPDFDLGISGHRLENQKFWDFTLTLAIPLFFWQPKRGEIAETEALIAALEKESEHLKNAISLEVEEAYRNAIVAHDQIRLYEEEVLSQAEEVYQMFYFRYEEGEIGGIELIEARKTLIEARISYAEALYNYALSLAALEKSVGMRIGGDEDD